MSVLTRLGLPTRPARPATRQDAAGVQAAAGLAATVGPDCVEVSPRWLRLGYGYAATFAVTGYPATVTAPWLEPILCWPGRLDVAIHIEPIGADTAAGQLRRQRAKLESSRRIDADRGRLGDPGVDAAAEDAAELADRIARGAAKLFRTGVYITVHAANTDALAEACAQVRAAAASVLLDLQPVTHRHLQGWTSSLPLGTDAIRMRRTLDTYALAAAFPLASPDLPAPLPGDQPPSAGVLYGVNLASAGVVMWDRWIQDNHNSVVLARSGAGKSYLVKLEVLRNLYHGVHVAVVDPEDEYVRLAERVGGTVVQLGAPGVRLNPLDIPTTDRRPDALTRRALFLHTVIAVLVGSTGTNASGGASPRDAGMRPEETAALDRAIIDTYHHAGITADPATWDIPAPLLRDLACTLQATDGPAAKRLAARLAPWVTGSFKDLFDGPTTSRPDGHLVVWSLRHLADEVKTIGTLLALDSIWRQIDQPPRSLRRSYRPEARRRLAVVDEAWMMLRDGAAATWLFKMAKAARKRNAGLAVVTQDAADVLGTELGQAVIANSATQILMRQAPQAIDRITDAFGLTDAERHLLLSARRGEALLVAGSHRVRFEVVSSAEEHQLAAAQPPGPEPATGPATATAALTDDAADLF
jgi:type IV secretory pathway VirB4 component